MGKTRGHGTRKGGASSGRSRGGRGGGRPAKDGAASDFESGSDSDRGFEEKKEKVKKQVGQPATAGMMPSSDSEDDDYEPVPVKPKAAPAAAPAAAKPAAAKAKGAAAEDSSSGEYESTTEEESSSGEEETDSDDDGPSAHRPPAFMGGARSAPTAKPSPAAATPPKPLSEDAEQARKDLERLAIIREKREQQRLERIAKEGRDRYAAENKADAKA